MRQSAEEPDLGEALALLQRDQEALLWSERRELASSLAEALGVGKSSGTALALVYLLADDPKPEVRKEIADLLLLVPNDDFIN